VNPRKPAWPRPKPGARQAPRGQEEGFRACRAAPTCVQFCGGNAPWSGRCFSSLVSTSRGRKKRIWPSSHSSACRVLAWGMSASSRIRDKEAPSWVQPRCERRRGAVRRYGFPDPVSTWWPRKRQLRGLSLSEAKHPARLSWVVPACVGADTGRAMSQENVGLAGTSRRRPAPGEPRPSAVISG
jgi:hypothetical protein